MNPAKVIREKVEKLTDLPNVGKTIAADFARIGITHPKQLRGETKVWWDYTPERKARYGDKIRL
ncbi:MAG: hypothetical protein NTY39_02220 [Campylobacterales bacterium]|nr:hypothetical protein [Campylobacterales bacterium]